jgi:DNA-binding MarR family transcriptional regulator
VTEERPADGAATPGTESLQPADSPGFLLWRATLRWQRLMTATLRPLGLTHGQFVILVSLWWLTRDGGEEPTQRRLADHAGTDPMMTSQILRVLEGRDLITRANDPRDSRTRRLAVTDNGSALARRAVVAVEAADAGFFAVASGRRFLLDFLRQLGAETHR